MVVGGGQLAKAFSTYAQDANICIFASGVSNSSCIIESEFDREKNLLLFHLNSSKDKKFVYFSSCALSSNHYEKTPYYNHKRNMEQLIKDNSNNYNIFRIPQLFGDLILHKTLINFFYKAIIHQHQFNVYDQAYRYVIEIRDLKMLVDKYILESSDNTTIDFANPYRYSVLDLVKSFEDLLGMKAKYNLVEKEDAYLLNLDDMNSFIENHNIKLEFGKEYFERKIKQKLSASSSVVLGQGKENIVLRLSSSGDQI